MYKKNSFFTDYFTVMLTFQSEFEMKKFRVFSIFAYLLLIIFTVILFSVGYVYYKYFQTKQFYTNYQELKKDFLQKNINYKIIQEDLQNTSNQLRTFQVFDTKIRNIADAKNYENIDNINSNPLIQESFLEEANSTLEIQERNLKNQIRNIQLERDLRKNSFSKLEVIINHNLKKLARIPSINPIKSGRFSSRYGIRKDPFDGALQFHKGVDWSSALYTPIYAPAAGRVVYAYYEGSYGNIMAINHGYNITSRYAHLSKFEKKVGDLIKRGEIIARVGNSGERTTGHHLHYEIIVNGKHVDPLSYIIDDDTINALARNTNGK